VQHFGHTRAQRYALLKSERNTLADILVQDGRETNGQF
jgi:hypothetical protein